MTRALAAYAFAAYALVACQPNYEPKTVSVRVAGSPPDAVVTVDDVSVGKLAAVVRRGLALRPGRHRITVERQGYFPFDRAFEASDAPVRIDVALAKIPE